MKIRVTNIAPAISVACLALAILARNNFWVSTLLVALSPVSFIVDTWANLDDYLEDEDED